MKLTATEHKYVQLDERNVPIIAATTMKVIELVTSVKAYGWGPEEFALQLSSSNHEPDSFRPSLLLGP